NPSPPAAAPRPGRDAILDLLMAEERLSVADLADRLGVTATAVRQRLSRLIEEELVDRSDLAPAAPAGTAGSEGRRRRGRPSYSYMLTERGRRSAGDNFLDLAVVLWREIRGVREPAIRQGLIARIGAAMAGMYRDQVAGQTSLQRLDSVASLLRSRQIACAIERPAAGGGLTVLASHACPYPDVAEQDRGICAAERLMLQELVGAAVELSACRLDGDACCRFTVGTTSDLSLHAGTCNKPA
ncbi:MAG: helix-turn-helix transcriptional regulator, partial [Planctomycetaceae bacterium]